MRESVKTPDGQVWFYDTELREFFDYDSNRAYGEGFVPVSTAKGLTPLPSRGGSCLRERIKLYPKRAR